MLKWSRSQTGGRGSLLRLSSTIPHLTAALLAIAQTAAPAQSAPAPAPAATAAPPTLHIRTNLVLVDVVATDRNRPVLGLDQKAFHVFEDGKEQPIASFDQHQPPAAPPQFITMPLPPGTYTNMPDYPPSSAVNVLLLDALNTRLRDQMFVRQKMIDYLGSIKPGTTMAVFTLSNQLRMITPFTNDAGALVKALKSAKTSPQETALLNARQMDTLNTTQLNSVANTLTGPAAQPSGDLSRAIVMNAVTNLQQFEADQVAAQLDARVTITLDAMRQLAAYLGGIQGRKNIIWFSGAFPLVLFPDSSLFDAFANVTSYNEEIQKTSDALTAARVAIYPVDAHGLIVPTEFNASRNFVGTGPAFASQIVKEDAQWAGEKEAMREIAKETGGQAYVDTNDLDKAIAGAIENGSNYYTVAYVPPSKHLDGKYHKIEVRVDGKTGLKLAYRRGYYAAKPGAAPANQDSPSSLFAAALAHDAPPATQILFRARVLPASAPQLKGVNIPGAPAGQLKGTPHPYVIDLTLDAHGLTFNPATDGSHRAAIELAMVAYDADGQPANFYRHSFQLGLKDAQMQHILASGIGLRLPFDVPAGQIYLRIGVDDLNANRAGSLEVPLQVSAP